MGLKTSPVYRCLDKKSMVFGFEEEPPFLRLYLVFPFGESDQYKVE